MKILCVSGGVDSMVLLHNYKFYYEEEFVVAHVNYNYRDDSLFDERLVLETCRKYGVKCEVLNLDKYTGSGFEEWARNIRYGWFKKLVQKYNASGIVTAHNANDQVETIIMNKRRGCGLYGLGGMRNSDYHDRPLLWVTKDDIYAYAHEHSIVWREDSTNTDTNFTRNKIRSQLTKARVEYLVEYCKRKQDEYCKVLKEAKRIYKCSTVDDVCVIDAPIAGSEELWKLYFHHLFKDKTQLTKKLFNLLLSSDQSTRVVLLPNKIRVRKRKKHFFVEKI